MSEKGGLPAIHPYEISRHWYLHELTAVRAFKRVHGMENRKLQKQLQGYLCNLRKEHYK